MEWSDHALTGEDLRRIGQAAVNLMGVILSERERYLRERRAEQEREG